MDEGGREKELTEERRRAVLWRLREREGGRAGWREEEERERNENV